MIRSIYSVLMTDKIEESSLFYKTWFGFAETFACNWYVSLSHPDGGELAFIAAKHETIPARYRSDVKGIIMNIDVDDAAQMYEDIQKQDGGIIVMPLRDEDYGQRHFFAQDPNGIMIDVIENIAPSEEFQNNYSGET